LYSLDASGTFIRWDIQSLQPIDQSQVTLLFNEDAGGASPLAVIDKTGQFIAIVNYDEIRIWDIATNSLYKTILPDNILGGMPVTVLTFSLDGRSIAAGAFYRAFAWSIDSGESVPNASIDTGRPVTSVAFSPDGNFFAAGSEDGIVHIKDLQTGEQRDQPASDNGVNISTNQLITTNITGHKDQIASLAFSPDSQMLVSAGNDQTFIVWDDWHWPLQGPIDVHHSPVIGVAFNPVNNAMASLDTNGTLMLWDISNSSSLFHFWDNDQFPLDLLDGQQLAPEECAGIVNQPESSCFVSPDGKIMISSYLTEAYGAYNNARTRDSVIGIWDFETQQLIGQRAFFSYEPEWVAFSADNKYARMIGNSYEVPFIVINTDVSSCASIACAIANRNLSEEEWRRYLGDLPYQSICQ
jgi:WD40 repeat protein